MKKVILALAILLVSSSMVFAQSHKVNGTVSDPEGEPIPGITVQVKGVNVGTVTDGEGNYTISVSSDGSLIYSGIGYERKEIEVKGRSEINISLGASTSELNELVVTALGVNRQKKSLGYSIQSVNTEELNQGNNPDLSTALQGKVAGVEVRPSSGMPGASAQIFIRGARFFDDNNGPLYVVDGMPINSGTDFNVTGNGVTGTDFSSRSIDIDPANIESISVLKGQAASALYGTRASNGVIMITTKSGSNVEKGKPVISFSTNYQFDKISRWPDLQMKYAQGSGGVFDPLASTSWGPKIEDLPDDPNYGGNVPNSFNNNNPTASTKGKYWVPQKKAWVTPHSYYNAKDFFKTGLTINNNLSIAQSGELGNYSLGIGTTNQNGIIPESGMDRYNLNFSGDFNASEKVKVGASVHYTSTSIDKMPSGNNSYLFELFGVPPSYDLAGTPIHEEDDPFTQIQYRGGVFDNPYWGTKYNKFNEKTRRFFGNAYVSYNPIPELNIKYQAGLDEYTTDRRQLWAYGSGPHDEGDLTNGALMNRTFNSLLNINYDKQLNEDWHINAMVGNEINDNYLRKLSSNGSGFVVPGWNNMDNASTQTATGERYKKRTVGFYGQLGAGWRDMVFLNLTGRNDIVSTMPHGNRSFFYPSVSLSWVFSELESLQNKGIYGKLRASYAEVGAPGQYLDRVYVQGSSGSGFLDYGIDYPFAGVIGFRPNSTLYDQNLKPQNTQSFELGFDLGILHNRINLHYTYTNQDTRDQIFAIPLAGSTGYSQIVRNAGEMSSNVHEATLDIIPVQKSDFKWNLTFNFTKVINKVKSLAPGVSNIYLGGFVDPQVRAAIGYTYPSIYGTSFLKNDAGQVLVDDDSNSPTYGMPLMGSDEVIGSVTPDFILGMNNSFQYKFVRLSFLFEWKNGGQIYSGANRLIDLYGTSEKTADRASGTMIFDGVKASTVTDKGDGHLVGGDKNDIKISGANQFQTYYSGVVGGISEAQIYGTSFIKLRSVELNFSLPKEISKKTKFFRTASLSLFARNILIWTELPNFDPESSQGNGNMQGGFDYMSLPQTTSYGVGLNFTF